MKNTIKSILAAMLAVSMTGCTVFPGVPGTENTQNELNADESSTDSLKIIVNSLDDKNKDLLKTIFSVETLARAEDIDEGIDYIFNIYKGKYIKTINVNQSGQTTGGGKASFTDRYAVIETTEGCFKINWKIWGRNDNNPEYIGVYSLSVHEYDENENAGIAPRTAGVYYPEHEMYQKISENISSGSFNGEKQKLKDVFSDELNKNSEDSGTLDMFMENYSFGNTDIDVSWIKGDMYFMKIRGYDIYLCLKTDANSQKVTSIRVLDVNEYTDEDAENYDFSNDKNEIYM